VHRDLMDQGCLTGTERGQGSHEFVAGLRDRGLTPDDAADVVCQVFGVARGVAQLYLRSHPAWSSEPPAGGTRLAEAEAFRPQKGRQTMLVKDIMTHDIAVVSPGDTLAEAARMMDELDIGPLPVCEGNRVVGMLTDRDITVRATAAGCDPKTTLVSDTMSHDVVCCYEDQDVSVAAGLMKEKQIRRLLVMNRAGDLVGIVSLADLATEARDPAQPGEVLEKVSQPGG